MMNVSEPLGQECQHFLDCITNQKTPLTHAADAVQVVSIIELATNPFKKIAPYIMVMIVMSMTLRLSYHDK